MLRTVAGLLLVLLTVPTGWAHQTPGGLNHISPTFGNLGPHGNRTFHATFEDGEFVEGWVFLIYGRAVDPSGGNASLDVSFGSGGLDVARWRWAAGDFRLNTTGIPATSEYEIRLENPNAHNMSYVFYFDQSCDCLAKPITLPQGVVVFNYGFEKGDHFSFGVPVIDGWALRAELATRIRETSLWPSDFEVHQTASHEDKGWLYVNYTAQRSGEHYFFIHADEGVNFSTVPHEVRVVEITPLLEREEKAPGIGVLAVGAVAVGWALARRRRA